MRPSFRPSARVNERSPRVPRLAGTTSFTSFFRPSRFESSRFKSSSAGKEAGGSTPTGSGGKEDNVVAAGLSPPILSKVAGTAPTGAADIGEEFSGATLAKGAERDDPRALATSTSGLGVVSEPVLIWSDFA